MRTRHPLPGTWVVPFFTWLKACPFGDSSLAVIPSRILAWLHLRWVSCNSNALMWSSFTLCIHFCHTGAMLCYSSRWTDYLPNSPKASAVSLTFVSPAPSLKPYWLKKLFSEYLFQLFMLKMFGSDSVLYLGKHCNSCLEVLQTSHVFKEAFCFSFNLGRHNSVLHF